jgi:hypothetical protein
MDGGGSSFALDREGEQHQISQFIKTIEEVNSAAG